MVWMYPVPIYNMSESKVRNDLCDHKSNGFKIGRSVPVFALWQIVKWFFFTTTFPWPSAFKVALLRMFGAKMGQKILFKPRVNVHFPWRLQIGDHAWIGEDVMIVNFEDISIGANACVSQRALICAGNHDFRDRAMHFRNKRIIIADGAWVGAQVFVAPGVVIGTDAVITAGSVLLGDAKAGTVYSGNPAVAKTSRWK